MQELCKMPRPSEKYNLILDLSVPETPRFNKKLELIILPYTQDLARNRKPTSGTPYYWSYPTGSGHFARPRAFGSTAGAPSRLRGIPILSS